MIENHSPPQTLDEVIRWLTQQSRRAKGLCIYYFREFMGVME